MNEFLHRIEIVRADITKFPADAIVAPANNSLLGGSGLDGSIHRAAGPGLRAECSELGGCRTGEAKITGGYNLTAVHVIHAVGPIYRGGNSGEAEKLRDAYRNTLKLANEYMLDSVAFPALSCGAYVYPVFEAAEIALDTIMMFMAENEKPRKVFIVLQDEHTFLAYKEVFEKIIS